MIKFNKKQLFAFLQRALYDDYRVVAQNIKICLKWEQLLHDKPNKRYKMSTDKSWEYIISYQDAYSIKYLTLADIYMYIDYHYPNNSNIDVQLIVKDNPAMYRKENITEEEWEDEWKSLCEITTKIDLEEDVNLTKEDIQELISFALDNKDKEYFDELVDRMKKLSYNEDKENA